MMAPSKKRKVEEAETGTSVTQPPPDSSGVPVAAEPGVGEGTDDGYEVEKILDHKRDKNSQENGATAIFKIKWKGYPESEATWEPITNLSCPQLLSEYWRHYYSGMGAKGGQSGITGEMAKSLQTRLDKELKDCNASIIRFRRGEDGTTADFTFRFNVDKYRERQQEELRIWAQEINRVCDVKKEAGIDVENTVDFETVPQDFTYITDYRAGAGVRIPEEALAGCECGPGNCNAKSNKKNNCCPSLAGVEFMYDPQGKVKGGEERRPIYECNSKCACGPECVNRVVQKGRKFPLTIYRTKGKGWGVKTRARISKDTFVTEYVGEVITEEEAERRGKIYDAEGATYLFDLDFNDSANVDYAVDAKQYGNVAHFINHSCDPNLQIRAVWIECMEASLPRLAFFSTREIKVGEELTFNYMMTGAESNGVPKEKGAVVKQVKCTCGAKTCKGYLI